MPDGYLVFEGVDSVLIEPPGAIPNDTIHDIRAHEVDGGAYLIVLNVDAIDERGERSEVTIQLRARRMALEASGDHRRITQ